MMEALPAAAGEDWESAVHHYDKALGLAEELPHRVDQARVRYWYARMLLDRNEPGDRDRARTLLTEARSMSESIGMHGQVRWIDQQLGR